MLITKYVRREKLKTYKLLFLTSHVGLGHVARDYAFKLYLERIIPNIEVDWCSAEPALSFLDKLGERVVSVCRSLTSFSTVVEDLYNGRIKGLRDLGSRLKILRDNYAVIGDLIKSGKYDLIFADEFWEIVYSAPRSIKKDIVFGSDLVYMPYRLTLKGFIIPLILNNYFKRSFIEFNRRIYLNDPGILDDYKWYWLLGGRVREWVYKHMYVAGLTTSYLPEELPDKNTARKMLGLNTSDLVIVISVGGTSTRSKALLECIDSSAKKIIGILKKSYPRKNPVIIALTGPRTRWNPRHSIIHVVKGVQPRLINYYVASDLFITRSGRTTTADLLCMNKPAVLIPIKGHVEQEEIALDVARRYGYPVIFEDECYSENIIKAIRHALSTGKIPGKPPCEGVYNFGKYLASVLYGSSRNRDR